MEEKLAHVQAVVNDRWQQATEKQRRNALLERRKSHLHRELQACAATGRAAQKAAVAEMQRLVLCAELQLAEAKTRVKRQREEISRRRARNCILESEVRHFQRAIALERKRSEAFAGLLQNDRARLEHDDREGYARKRKETIDKLHAELTCLQAEALHIESDVAAAQRENRDLQETKRQVKRQHDALQEQLDETRQLNRALQQRLAKEAHQTDGCGREKSSQRAAELERRATAILDELNNFDA